MKDVARVERTFTGWIIGTRRWSLKAFDEKDDLIYEHNTWEANIYITYIKFLTKLRDTYGYNLTLKQRRYIKSEPFIYKKFKSAVKKHHIVTIAQICGYTKEFLNTIQSKSKDVQLKIAYDIGLEPDEFYFILEKYG